ncbi:acyl-CoA dehydrogenase family protein [Peterkaempfera bronchialis]|uniref:Acyl-CoA dehydrogenase n=1 Tax=Peterkaempfera bronchialis TaxID=2126346 RepID=A0A345SRD8_9ACTN|nr:acyl-CoA dehydrogenase family protein [Peterkaempfera bronchialis]AXI76293.1 acyl-CoA dehydrogenase [Peterkaempfera bronchialis]
MQTTTSDEREEFRRAVRGFLAQASTEDEVRRLMADPVGYDRGTWQRLTGELGLSALLVPESAGGQGLTPVEMAVVLEETGRSLLCAPAFSSAAVATLALRCADRSLTGPVLSGLAAGSTLATLASDQVPGRAVTAAEAPGGWRLSGAVTHVLDAHIADLLLVPVTADGRVRLFAVGTGTEAVEVHRLSVLDLTRKQFRVDLSAAPAQLLDDDFGAGLEAALDGAAILASAELLGAAGRCLELAVAYALEREQFGRPIGTFQAVKHLLADCLSAVEQMRAAVGAAAEFAGPESDPAERAEIASVVKSYCSEAAPRVAETLIQVLGGIGFTWEHPAHLYLRRIKSLEMMYGNAARHRARLARTLELEPA